MPALSHDDLAAHLTDIAYRTLLQHGLRRPFLEVELELWQQIRSAFQDGLTASPNRVA